MQPQFIKPVKVQKSIKSAPKFLHHPSKLYYCVMTASPSDIYNQRILSFSAQITRLQVILNRIAWSRFLTIIALVAVCWYLKGINVFYALGAAAAFLAVFLRLVAIAARQKQSLRNASLLLQINQQELRIAAGEYVDLPDGKEFLPPLHDYAHDLDIFGRSSLYQYLNRTSSEQGSRLLSGWLLQPARLVAILERQEAAKTLSPEYAWRQQLLAHGMAEKITVSTQEQINSWLAEPHQFSAPHWKWIRFAGPAIMLVALALYWIDIMPAGSFYLLLIIFFAVTSLISRKVSVIYQKFDKVVAQLRSLYQSILWIESARFTTPLLKQTQELCTGESTSASRQIEALTKILDRLEYRLNPLVFLPLNIFLFWDLQQVLALEQWKERNRHAVSNWFDALQNMEALCTVATAVFNHPQWAFPHFDPAPAVLRAEDAGHPLIGESKRVNSSFSTEGAGKISLITGSNMAGKSTFLRSIGVNIVLAMTGSPVCARSFTISHMRVISSMRVTDNLEENTSTFYAELKKLRHIIEEVNKGEKVYLLLDEILRGTNSLDRHSGSKALVQQLIRHNAAGMLATHDVELAALQQDYPAAISNYHFDVQVAGDELYFDYKLKHGVCQSLNASILMKKIGIEFV